MPTEPTAEQQGDLSEYARNRVDRLRVVASNLEARAAGDFDNLVPAEVEDIKSFLRGLADKCRDAANEIQSALDSGQPMEDVIRLVAKLWADCTRAQLSGDMDDANVTPRNE